jgi:hypothetical protein
MRKVAGSFALGWENRGHLNGKLCGTLAGIRDLGGKIPLTLAGNRKFPPSMYLVKEIYRVMINQRVLIINPTRCTNFSNVFLE